MNAFPGIVLTGVRSGLWYLQELQKIARQSRGNEYVLPLKILQVPFEEINALLPYNMEKAAQKLLPYLKEMKEMKARPFLLANITLHETFDFYKPKLIEQIPIIPIADVLKAKLPKSAKNIAILGTLYTMNPGYINGLIPKHHQVISIEKDLQDKVNQLRIRFNYEVDAAFANEVFHELMVKYPEVDTFILGCTELSIALEHFDIKNRFFNLPQLQCEQLVEAYFT